MQFLKLICILALSVCIAAAAPIDDDLPIAYVDAFFAAAPTDGNKYENIKWFELVNHLGNISDKIFRNTRDCGFDGCKICEKNGNHCVWGLCSRCVFG